MRLTHKQKEALRSHWPYIPLRIMQDGTVLGLKGSWGILYFPIDTERHLRAIGLWDEEQNND